MHLGKADWPQWGSLLKSPVWFDPAFATLRQRLLNPQGGTRAAAEPSTGSKDIITFQAEFGDWRKMVIGGADLGIVAAGINTHCVLVECEQDVPCSEEVLRIANGGTPVIVVGKALVVQDWVDHNTGDGASEMCNFSTNSTVYLGSQEERQMFPPNPKALGLGGMLSLTLMSPKAASLPPYIGNKLALRPSIITWLMPRVGLKRDVETGIFFASRCGCIQSATADWML